MVEILCPHCEGEIELDDDASGEFVCPLCDGEFEWNVKEEESFDNAVTYTDNRIISSHGFNEMHPVTKVAVGAFLGYKVVKTLLFLIFLIFFVILILIYLIFGPLMNGSFFA